MKILYKYYSDLPLDYFNDPTLKLAQPKSLNDPFESNIQQGIIKSDSVIRQKIKERPSLFDADSTDKTIIRNIYNMLNTSGVTSLSETQRNILMWAHYANEHRGLCIGYDSDPFNFKSQVKNSNDIFYKLHKVNYDTSRYDPYHDELNNETRFKWIASVTKKILTTKSDEWIYEKEHRYITPVYDCDYILSKEKMKHSILSRNIYKSHRPTKLIKEQNGLNKYQATKHGPIFDTYVFDLQKRNNLTFLKKIAPQKIKSIYLGYRYPKDKLIDFMQSIYSPECKIKHVKIFRMELCPMEFKLIPRQIYPRSKGQDFI